MSNDTIERATVPQRGRTQGRRAVLAALGVGVVSACGPVVTTVTKAAGTGSKTATPTRKPTPKPTTKASAAPAAAPTTTTTTKATTPAPTATVTKAPVISAPDVTSPGQVVTNLVGTDQAWHLARRASFGATPALAAEIKTMGATAWLNQQLAPAGIDDSECDAYLTRFPTLPMTPLQLRAGAIPRYSWDAMVQLGQASIARALFSKRQLFEVMVEFWSNHFNIATPSGDVWDLKTTDDRDVIRKNALGKFSTMLKASGESPAMMVYLDNASSSVDTLNENYGRELLELHTVGIEAGYTHDDVINSARILTGNTVGRHGENAYYNDWHYVGPVKVLDFADPNDDDFDGLTLIPRYLDYLAHHPSTARRLATKLAVRFVSDTPPASLVTALANVYLANDTAIAPVLKALFASSEFAASIGQKTRRPFEDLIASARAMGVTPAAGDAKSLSGFYWLSSQLGQAPMAWKPPNGYPDVAGAWLSAGSLLGRWNAHAGVVGAWWKDGFTTPTPATWLGSNPPATIGGLVDAIAVKLLGAPLAGAQRAAVIGFAAGRTTGFTEASSSANTIKWDLGVVMQLVLNSPNWIQR